MELVGSHRRFWHGVPSCSGSPNRADKPAEPVTRQRHDKKTEKDLNYYRRYVGDYLKDTSRLSMIEHGAYGLLLDYYYAEEKPIPLDMDEVFRMVRAIAPAERKAIEKVLLSYFERREDGYHNARADHEIEVSKKARDNGKGGGRPITGKVTGSVTGSVHSGSGIPPESETGSGHPPTTNHQPPAASRQPSPASQSQPPSGEPAARTRPARVNGTAKPETPKTTPCWEAYSAAYSARYGVAPTRNAKVSGMLAKFIERVPAEEAPNIAAFFVQSKRGLYVSAKHAVDLLLRDAEALRTEWLTGRSGTDTEARIGDRTAATGNAFAPLIAEAEERERLAGAK